MLDRGGNAVDAGVAAAFVAGVLEPIETTLAGSGFMLLALPDGTAHSVEFGPRAPLAAHEGMFKIDEARQRDAGLGISTVVDDHNVQGALAAGVPTTLAGMTEAHARFGRLPLNVVLKPAIEAAFDGFDVDPYFSLEALENIHAIRRDPGATALFLRNDLPPTPAHLGSATLGTPARIKQAALGRMLQGIADEGVQIFYSGRLGDEFLRTHRELGGLLSRDDLQNCRPVFAAPRRLRFRDCDVLAPVAPCGGLTQLQILNIWQALYPDTPPATDTFERLSHFAQASWHAFADRYHWLGDPDFVPVPEDALMSTEYARHIAHQIRAGHPAPVCEAVSDTPWNYFAGRAAHDPWSLQNHCGAVPPRWTAQGSTEPTAGTTHVSVIDEDGMAVSITHTAANHCGAKVVCERTGLLLDATMGWFNARPNAANSIAGGKRPLANMGPMLLIRDGVPLAALGAPGGRRIIDAVVQIVLNLVERGMSPEEAVTAPRVDASGNTLLASERLADVLVNGNGFPHGIKWVAEQHQGYSYEMARPVLVVRRDRATTGAIDPFTKGYAKSQADSSAPVSP
jgi:gamma-glutamyltranspeptidase/glutathione hydrolase